MTATDTATTTTTPASSPSAGADVSPPLAIVEPSGVVGWFTSSDHKRVGRLYIVTSLAIVVAALVVSALLALERIDTSATNILRADSVSQLFSLYRVGLIFCGIAPLFLGFAIAVVPLQVGARNIAFGRAAAASYWTWLFASGVLIGAYAANGGPGGGNSQAVDLFLLAFILLAAALALGWICVATTILALRAPGMRLDRVPMFSWASLVGGATMILTMPVLVADLVFLVVDHHYGRVWLSGNAGVGQVIEWALRQPQVFAYAIPALGIVADVVATASRRRQPQREVMLVLLALAALLSFGDFTQDFFAPKVMTQFVYVAMSVVVILPAVGLLGLGGLAMRSAPRTPVASTALALGAGLSFLIAAVAAALFSIDALNLRGTAFEQGQGEFVLLGLGLLGALAGLVHWGPKLWGRLLPGLPSLGLGVLAFLAVIVAAGANLLAGALKEPRGAVTFVGKTGTGVADVLAFIGVLGLLLLLLAFLGLAVRSFAGKGAAAGDDPWHGQTLEWATSSPPPAGNFALELPEVRSAEPLLDSTEAVS